MAHLRGFKILLIKAYFDKGLGVTSYAKYLIALLGLYSVGSNIDLKYTAIIGVIYVISCFFIGYYWYKFKLTETENEIGNIFNPFQREVRERLKGKI